MSLQTGRASVMAQRVRTRYATLYEQGLCVKCGKVPHLASRKVCEGCIGGSGECHLPRPVSTKAKQAESRLNFAVPRQVFLTEYKPFDGTVARSMVWGVRRAV